MEYEIRPVIRYELVRKAMSHFVKDEVVGEFHDAVAANMARRALINDPEEWKRESEARNKRVATQSYGEGLGD
jgi:hypothetical protein